MLWGKGENAVLFSPQYFQKAPLLVLVRVSIVLYEDKIVVIP